MLSHGFCQSKAASLCPRQAVPPDTTQNPWEPSCLSTHSQPCSAFPAGTVYTHCDNLCFTITGKRIWC